MLKVYMAGKITKNCWRHDIVDGLRYHEYYEDNIVFDKKFIYVGPYFIGCDHGCYHGNSSHGRGNFDNDINGCIQDASMYSSQDIVNLCFCGINKSDVVFCWLDSDTAYGTLVELGYAYTMGKVIYVACNDEKVKNLKDMWFALELANEVVHVDSAEAGWKEFKKWINDIGFKM